MPTIRLANYGGQTYSGWVRCTTDDIVIPKGAVRGRRVGLLCESIDVRVTLPPSSVVDFEESNEEFTLAPLPGNPLAVLGGLATIAGIPFGLVSVEANGAAYDVHLRARVGPMLCVDVWFPWYPDQPGWTQGEVVVTASNPGCPDTVATVPEGFTLKLGDAICSGFTLQAGDTLAQGQARAFPVTLLWPRYLDTEEKQHSAGMVLSGNICANGLDSMWPEGNPSMEAGKSALDWTRATIGGAAALLNGWKNHPAGVLADSHSTGKEGDQVFVGGPEACADGLGAEKARYYLALGQLRRTTHHLERDGSHLRIDGHPSLTMWDGMPHIPSVSFDQLGQSRRPSGLESHGWSGNWEEHWLINGIATAYRATGSRALQWELEHQARQFLWQVKMPRTGAARAVGWRGLVAYHLWHNLDNRALAEKVAELWRAHVTGVLIPQLGSKVADIWQVVNDPRIATDNGTAGPAWLPYQASVGAYGLDLACETLGPPEGRELALRAAKAVMERAFDDAGDGWCSLAFNGTEHVPLVEKEGAHYGENVWIWHTVGLATILKHEPDNARARFLFDRIVAKQGGGGQWVPPEMVAVR